MFAQFCLICGPFLVQKLSKNTKKWTDKLHLKIMMQFISLLHQLLERSKSGVNPGRGCWGAPLTMPPHPSLLSRSLTCCTLSSRLLLHPNDNSYYKLARICNNSISRFTDLKSAQNFWLFCISTFFGLFQARWKLFVAGGEKETKIKHVALLLYIPSAVPSSKQQYSSQINSRCVF